MIKLATCKDCKFYKPIDEKRGDCFGHEVQANMPAENCPAKSFQPITIRNSPMITKTATGLRAQTKNIPSQKTLEKAGFSKEGLMRKSWFAKGEYIDQCLYSLLREEWKEPKILKRT